VVYLSCVAADVELIGAVRAALRGAAQPELARPMQAYMKSATPFLGVRVPMMRTLTRAEAKLRPFRGSYVVTYHKTFPYLLARFGLEEFENVEPKPGIEPTTAHLASVVEVLQREPAKMVLRAAYQSDLASQWIAERAGLKAVALPFSVGGTEGAKDLFGLFDDTIQRLLKAAA
jgi:zinc/manganese transport system substrate-binding protein